MALITTLSNNAWDLCEHRNGILHNSQNIVTDREERALNRDVKEAFNKLQSMMLPIHDRHLLSLPLAHLLKKNMLYKEVLLRNASTVIGSGGCLHSLHHSLQGSPRGMRRCMGQFLRCLHNDSSWFSFAY